MPSGTWPFLGAEGMLAGVRSKAGRRTGQATSPAPPPAVPVSGLPRPCGGRPRSPAPARAAASEPWPSSGCSPVPRPERTADPGTALRPRGGRRGRAGGAGDERGLRPGLGAYGPQWRGEAQAARWGSRSARGFGARPTPVSSSRLTSSSMALAGLLAAWAQRPPPRPHCAGVASAGRGGGEVRGRGTGPGRGVGGGRGVSQEAGVTWVGATLFRTKTLTGMDVSRLKVCMSKRAQMGGGVKEP